MVRDHIYAALGAFSLLIGGVGCALADNDPVLDPTETVPDTPEAEPEPAPSLSEALRAPAAFAVMADAETTAVTLTAGHMPSGASKVVEMPVLGGYIDVHATAGGLLVIDHLAVDLADLEVPAAFAPPDGMVLTGIRAHLAGPHGMEAVWSEDGDAAFAEVAVDIVVDWAIRTDNGEVVPLSPLSLADVAVRVAIARQPDGALEVHVSGLEGGAFWSWAGVLELADLSLEISAHTI